MSDRQEKLVLNVRGGVRLCVPADISQITPYVLLEQEDWFEEEIRFVRRWLRPGMRAIDVGASYGTYTTAMARAVGDGGRVWAFEPTPATADYLQLNVKLNECGNVVLNRAAVSDRAGTVAFAAGARSELNAVVAAGGAPADHLQVKAVTLDQMAAGLGWSAVDFVKLDVEGHEIEAISGGATFFASNSPLVMFEIGLYDQERQRALLGTLAAMGYEFFQLLPGPLVLAPFDESEPADRYLINLFACKADRASQLEAEGFLARSDAIEPPVSPADAWGRYARSAPYARDLARHWPAKAGPVAGGGVYLEGLAAFAHSRDASRSARERLASLNHALHCVAEALDACDTVARRISNARLTWELGWRSVALEALGYAAGRLFTEGWQESPEPFLAPSARYERLGDGAGTVDWLKCAVVEQHDRLRNFSSIYSGASSLELLAPIAGLPFRSAEVDRRRQLMRLLLGLQSAPEAVPALCTGTDENLNPQFWSGAERGPP